LELCSTLESAMDDKVVHKRLKPNLISVSSLERDISDG